MDEYKRQLDYSGRTQVRILMFVVGVGILDHLGQIIPMGPLTAISLLVAAGFCVFQDIAEILR